MAASDRRRGKQWTNKLMACPEVDSSQLCACHLCHESYDGSINLQLEDSAIDKILVVDASTSSPFHSLNIPNPPPLPRTSYSKINRRLTSYNYVLDRTKDTWDKLFSEGYEADVHVCTDDKGLILAHSNVLGITSSVLRSILEQQKAKGGFRCVIIHGMPSEAVRAFIRFLYSSCYEPEDMMKFVLHLLVMSHAFTVPSLKRACIEELEHVLLTTDNVIDVLQLARECDAPRLSVICIHLIIKEFKTVSVSEGWKVMRQVKPGLEQELLEYLVETDSKRMEKLKKMEERKVYSQLYESMEALLHICRDGCRTIGPRDKMLKDAEATCGFPTCKVLESLIRHFSDCKVRVPGGCQHCKRMWQLFELHSRMCLEPDSCKVPLCRHFKDKMKQQNRKEDMKWRLLVRKVIATKGTISSISAWRTFIV